jgi:hypothetical protein
MVLTDILHSGIRDMNSSERGLCWVFSAKLTERNCHFVEAFTTGSKAFGSLTASSDRTLAVSVMPALFRLAIRQAGMGRSKEGGAAASTPAYSFGLRKLRARSG